MANYKNTAKGELVAIYRLEFYRNQKKWKFCKNEKKDAAKHIKQSASRLKLNETYRVEEPPEVEPPAPLDDAFLDTDSDENGKEQPSPAPAARRRRTSILDLQLQPHSDVDEWAARGRRAWRGADQVYSSELPMPETLQSRPPAFAGWPDTDQHTAPRNMLQDMLQHVPTQQNTRRNDAETIKQHIDSFDPISGRMEQNYVLMNQSTGRNVYQKCQMRQNMCQYNAQNAYNYELGLKANVENNLEQGLKQNMTQNVAYDRGYGLPQDYAPNVEEHLTYGYGRFGYDFEHNLKEHVDDNVFVENLEEPAMEGLLEMEMEWGREGAEGGQGANAEAERWLHESLAHFCLEPTAEEGGTAACDASLSSGDSAVFMRGAHARAHSSELQLVGADPCACASMSASELAHMSSAALRGSLRAHAAAARRLLRELRLRAQPYGMSHDPTRCSVPTRDVPPTTAGPPPVPGTERYVAGRGRGRRLLT
ncbi:uncharacterized protein LOC132903744 [Amyelois transitella]|uniref:uncharacterized protein LOC132903744 n=1 Tax=Amyelois transitella TaxID=680683 RepID=UPI002990816C|nr:uncharacterized protein LOC132903744 [Amyelois transitella]